MYSIFPNPASQNLTIEKSEILTGQSLEKLTPEEALDYIKSSKSHPEKNSKMEFALYDESGNKKLIMNSESKKVDISLSTIPKGNYILKIQDGVHQITKHITIEK